MSTIIRPELSKKSKYWIEKHRYYELKHFCLQYPSWKKSYISFDGYKHSCDNALIYQKNNEISDPTSKCVELREKYFDNMKLVEQTCIETDDFLHNYILISVSEGLTYEYLRSKYNIPCCRDVFYDRYRKFFWILDKKR